MQCAPSTDATSCSKLTWYSFQFSGRCENFVHCIILFHKVHVKDIYAPSSLICQLCVHRSILSRESIGKSFPQGQDFLIHSLHRGKTAIPSPLRGWCPKVPPAKVMSIANGKINVSLLMMRECIVFTQLQK